MAKQDKIYCGVGKQEVDFAVKVQVCLTDIPEQFKRVKDGKQWVTLNVVKRRQPSDKGHTHYVEVDTWVPDAEYKKNQIPDGQQQPPSAGMPSPGAEDSPF